MQGVDQGHPGVQQARGVLLPDHRGSGAQRGHALRYDGPRREGHGRSTPHLQVLYTPLFLSSPPLSLAHFLIHSPPFFFSFSHSQLWLFETFPVENVLLVQSFFASTACKMFWCHEFVLSLDLDKKFEGFA